jgi:hypothetical protein
MFNSTIFISRALTIIVAFLGFLNYPIFYKSVTVVDNQGADNGIFANTYSVSLWWQLRALLLRSA